jgi:hypothetical protein
VDSDGDGIPDKVEGRCQTPPKDTDGDGIPDYLDLDSDGDLIADAVEWRTGGCDPTAPLNDVDGDGIPNFQDLDSDGDGVPDRCEARGKASPPITDLALPVLDSNYNGKPDFLDVDADGDLLTDGLEDKNGNCVVDACETSRIVQDTDGDGVNDFIEATLDTGGACWGNNPAMTPAKAGKFYFVLPYESSGALPPVPTVSLLALSTTLNEGDVGFLIDTTCSMGSTIASLKASLSSTIIPALKTRIPSLGVGVAGHDDFPYGGYGSSGDSAFYISSSPNGYVTTVTATAQTAANALGTHNGNDGSESQVPAMYKALTGAALTWPTGSLAADTPPAGTFGAMRFRSSALPVLINATDISAHNSKIALDKTGTTYSTTLTDPYTAAPYPFTTYDIDQLVTTMNTLGSKFIGACSDSGARSPAAGYNCYAWQSYLADKTNSLVPPSAFTHNATCVAGQCCTGQDGAGVAPDGPTIGGVQQCRLVFSYSSTSGLAAPIVDGVAALLSSIKFDVYVQAYNDAAAGTDVVGNFMLKVEPQPAGGTDPVTGGICVTFPAAQQADNFTGPKALVAAPDGLQDTVKLVNPGALYCFNVTPKANSVVPETASTQVFRAWLRVLAIRPTGGTFALGADREVIFIVPPMAK